MTESAQRLEGVTSSMTGNERDIDVDGALARIGRASAELLEVLTALDDALARTDAISAADAQNVEQSRRDQVLGFGSDSDAAVAPETGVRGEAAEDRSIRHARALAARGDTAELRVRLASARAGVDRVLDGLRVPGPRGRGGRDTHSPGADAGAARCPQAPMRSGPSPTAGADLETLSDPGRLDALAASGLGAGPDPAMDWFAERVRHWMGVPVALVSLVRAEEQVFPGAAGLPDPYAESRRTPLTHSFCQYVAMTGRPLVIEDAREDPTLRSNLAVPELGVVAYAGMPLTDEADHVLGSLCAIDHVPRTWTPTELDALADLAAACSSELRLRLARADADLERSRRDRLELSLRDSFERSQTLLDISRSVGDSTTVEDVRAGLTELAGGLLGADHIVLLLFDGDGLRPVNLPGAGEQDIDSTSAAAAEAPSLLAVRGRRTVACATREEFDATFASAAGDRLRALDLHAMIVAPVLHPAGAVGSLVLGWDHPREHSPADLLLVNTVAAYTARALEHVGWVQHRVTVAREMQQAMLTDLPRVPGLELAARYEPADAREYVGGDWYDVLTLPGPDPRGDVAVSLSVGDIVGHELSAAIAMGQVRSMLRQAAWDHPGGQPSQIARAFETANTGVELRAAGTAVLAHARRLPNRLWSLCWTNAGHPPPVLVRPDGTAQLLDDHDAWFGLPVGHVERRRDHELLVPDGSLLLLYTDGLVERPGTDLDDGIAAVRSLLEQHATASPAAIVNAVVDAYGTGARDDIVVLAVRFT